MARGGDDYATEVATTIIEQMKAGTAPWQKPWVGTGVSFMPHNPVTHKPYRGGNAMWLMVVAGAKGYDDPRWMTYRQAESVKAQVRRGERGARIEYWMWEGEEPKRDAAGRVVKGADGTPVMERVRYERPRVFRATVFNASQIDGLAPLARPEPATWSAHERADALLAASGARLRHFPGDRACYDRVADEITLPERGQFPSGDAYYQTAFHELLHWTGHESRLARDLSHPFGTPGYAREELRAEIGSFMVGAELGIGHDPSRCAAYVADWISALQKDPREIFRASSDAEKARGFILDYERDKTRADGAERDAAGDVPTLREGAPAARSQEEANVGERRYLVVAFKERNELKAAAKAAGTWARFDDEKKAWYVPASVDPAPFQRWIGAPQVVAPEPAVEFAAALDAAGLRLEGAPVMDGSLHRVRVEGDAPGEKSGAYKGHLDGRPAGYIENWKTGYKEKWKASRPLDKFGEAEREQLKAQAAVRRAERAAAREAAARKAIAVGQALWDAAREISAAEAPALPYLAKKQVPPLGRIRLDQDGHLLVPVVDDTGALQSVQFISPDGSKRFLKGGRTEGGMFLINAEAGHAALEKGEVPVVLVAEGYATAATVARATGETVAVAFNAGNLTAVATSLRKRLPEAILVIAGDNDEKAVAKGRPNVGREKAEAAAAAAGGVVLLPQFAGRKGSDWNDLEHLVGGDMVRAQLVEAIGRVRAERDQGRTDAGRPAPAAEVGVDVGER